MDNGDLIEVPEALKDKTTDGTPIEVRWRRDTGGEFKGLFTTRTRIEHSGDFILNGTLDWPNIGLFPAMLTFGRNYQVPGISIDG